MTQQKARGEVDGHKERITMEHGSGGVQMGALIARLAAAYGGRTLSELGDAAVVEAGGRIALTTDSFVVRPLFFAGGDIGRLAVCGTVNDLLMRGARPRYLTMGMIIEEGLEISLLETVARSIARAADEAGVEVVTGDTKVIEGRGGLYLNTAGVGVFAEDEEPFPVAACQPGDQIMVSGDLGDHHAVIMSARLGIQNELVSDAAPLVDMVGRLRSAGVRVHAMRDVTRGGLATVLAELATASELDMVVEEAKLPVHPTVTGLCGLLGLDPLLMGNEGKLVTVVAKEDADLALELVRSSRYGEKAALVGTVKEGRGGKVYLETRGGSTRRVLPLSGEGLPRIC